MIIFINFLFTKFVSLTEIWGRGAERVVCVRACVHVIRLSSNLHFAMYLWHFITYTMLVHPETYQNQDFFEEMYH